MTDEWAGKIIDGRYEIESVLGEGGMGIVLRAQHRITRAHVAIKLLHAHLRVRGDLVERFLAEAQAPARINHPGIAKVTDAGSTPEGDPYLVMELLEGEPLSDVITRQRMPFEEIRRVALGMLDALGAAHDAGFVHRDLKPENVFIVQPSGAPKLLDFGIAKVLDKLGETPEKLASMKRSTAVGQVLGTLGYMSPEQLRNSKDVDARTDLWSLGVMLYEMIGCALPYDADSYYGMVTAIEGGEARPLTDLLARVPPALDAFMKKALAKRPAERFSSAVEMAAALRDLPRMILLRRVPGEQPVPFDVDRVNTTTASSFAARPDLPADVATAATVPIVVSPQGLEARKPVMRGTLGPQGTLPLAKIAAEVNRSVAEASAASAPKPKAPPAMRTVAAPEVAPEIGDLVLPSFFELDVPAPGAGPSAGNEEGSRPFTLRDEAAMGAPASGIAPPSVTANSARAPVFRTRVDAPEGRRASVIFAGGVVLAGAIGLGAFALHTPASAPPSPPPPTVTAAPSATVAPSAMHSTPAAANVRCGPGMVMIQGGNFWIGSRDDAEGEADEHPRHQVPVSSFCIDETEVTTDAYRACVEKSPAKCTPPDAGAYCSWDKPERGKHPVNCVDWKQATAYCNALGKRLPSEDEWEAAARGTEERRFPWGEAAASDQLCWDGEGSDVGKGKRFTTCPTGSHPQGDTPLGVTDMAGNVAEWTSTVYCSPYTKKDCAPTVRSVRGGSWDQKDALVMRGADRDFRVAAYRGRNVGLRCAKAAFK